MCGRVWLWAQRSSTSGALGLGVGDAQLERGTLGGWDSDTLPHSDHSVLVHLVPERNSFDFSPVYSETGSKPTEARDQHLASSTFFTWGN